MKAIEVTEIIDVTGVRLTPEKPDACLGNGEQGFECCCDECDYLLRCFPDFPSKSIAKKYVDMVTDHIK